MRRSPWSLGLTALVAIGVVGAMSACGRADRGTDEPAATRESVPAGGGSGTGTAASGIASSSPGVPPAPVGNSGTTVPFVKGEVSVKLDAGDYRAGSVIHVTVSNGMDRPVYTEDFKTACSVVILQRQDGGTWTDVLGCKLGRPTTTVTFGPGTGQTVELDPASFHLAGNGAGPAFGAGTYRVKFTCRPDPAAGGEDPLVAYSPVFTVR
jgi:hypothetical protein